MGGEILADYTPARLRIGGEVTHEQYRTIQELTDEGAQVDLGQFYEIGHDRTRGGAFAELEAYLTEQHMAFDRYSAPALGYDGWLVQYRPGMHEPVESPASGDNQERVVPVQAIHTLLTDCPLDGPAGEELVARLQALCGPVIGPLAKFLVRRD